MAFLLVFDFTTQYIVGFYFLTLSANFTTYLALMHVLRNLETPEGETLREKVKPFYWTMNTLYVAAVVCAVIPKTAPICDSLSIYPLSMFWCNLLFLANTGIFFYFWLNNFCLEGPLEGEDEEGEEDDTNKKPLIAEGYHARTRKIFSERLKSYGNYLKILSTVQIIIILLGKVFIDVGEFLTCTGGGFMWISTSISGVLFMFLIMLTIMMQSVMIEKFLYRIPNKYGMFDTIKHSSVYQKRMGIQLKDMVDKEMAVKTAVN